MASLIVVHGFRPVLAGSLEWVGAGKGGRTSPGLDARVSYWSNGAYVDRGTVGLPRRNDNESFPLLWNSEVCTI